MKGVILTFCIWQNEQPLQLRPHNFMFHEFSARPCVDKLCVDGIGFSSGMHNSGISQPFPFTL